MAAKFGAPGKIDLDEVWVILGQIYGSRLYRQFGDSMPQVWRARLSVCTPDEFRKALNWCSTNGNAYPPTLPEFWQACQHRPKSPPALPRPITPPAEAHRFISQIRKLLETTHARSE